MYLAPRNRATELGLLRAQLERFPTIPNVKNLEAYSKEEYRTFAEAILELTSDLVDVARLERLMASSDLFDFDLLDTAVMRLEDPTFAQLAFAWASGKTITFADKLASLKHILEVTRSVSDVASPLDLSLRLEMIADRDLERLVIVLQVNNQGVDFRSWLIETGRKKLADLSDRDVMQLWRQVRAEFHKDEGFPSMRLLPGILDSSFLDIRTPNDARDRIASYICDAKPRLIFALDKQGQSETPTGVFGIARLLALKGGGAEVSRRDATIASAIVRIIVIWTAQLSSDTDPILRALRLPQRGPLCKGPHYEEEKKRLNRGTGDECLQVLRIEAAKVLDLLLADVRHPSLTEELLIRYKLSMELMGPNLLKKLKKEKEEALTLGLSRFLIEHGVRAIGTKFGRAETDLVAEGPHSAIVLEAKKALIPPNANTVRSWLVQLQSYMDIEPVQVVGALVIYNFTSTIIVAPKRRIRDTYWIVPINLLQASPSKRKLSIEIAEASTGALVDVLIEGGQTTSPAKRKRRKKGGTGAAGGRRR